MKKETKFNWKAYKSIRKPTPPPTRVERPQGQNDYRRPQGNWRKWLDE